MHVRLNVCANQKLDTYDFFLRLTIAMMMMIAAMMRISLIPMFI